MPDTAISPFIFDSHVHVLPLAGTSLLGDSFRAVRSQIREFYRPVARGVHHGQLLSRHLPGWARSWVDRAGSLTPLPGLLLESTPEDLLSEMETHGVSQAVLIAHPPYCSNEAVLELASQHPQLVGVVNLPPQAGPTPDAVARLKDWRQHRGARALKIHLPASGEADEHYEVMIGAARELGMPVILHTGCIHIPLFYRAPDLGHAERFRPWFEKFPDVTFILAHMNFHEPDVAFDLAEEFANLQLETSWQPSESIMEAVRRVGAERVLFGSDWPIIGDNMAVGIERVRDGLQTGVLTEAQVALILGENARRIFGLGSGASTHASP